MSEGLFFEGVVDGDRLDLRRSFSLPAPLGVVTPLPAPGDGWVAATFEGLVHLAEDGSITSLNDIGSPAEFWNDGIADDEGRLWIGTQTQPRSPSGRLARLDPNGRLSPVLDHVTVSNGIGFATRDSFYYVDTLPDRALELVTLSDHGEVASRRVLHRFAHGNPDGLAVDAHGHAWVAVWDAGLVVAVDTAGTVVAEVTVPVRRPSAVCFYRDQLVVTTARIGLADPTPDDGAIFVADVGIGGAAASAWRPDATVRSRLGLTSAVIPSGG